MQNNNKAMQSKVKNLKDCLNYKFSACKKSYWKIVPIEPEEAFYSIIIISSCIFQCKFPEFLIHRMVKHVSKEV